MLLGVNLIDKFLFIILLYRQFRLCITALLATRASGKAHTPCRAVPWCRRCIKQNLSLRREQAPALRTNYNTNRQRKQVLCRNLIVGAIHESPVLILWFIAGDSLIAPTGKHPYENQPKVSDFSFCLFKYKELADNVIRYDHDDRSDEL